MATIAACPKCRGAVAVGEAIDPQSSVRCPTCGAQYQLQAALEIVPPSLEVIAAPKDQPAHTNASSETHAPDFPTLQEVPHLATHFASIPHAPESMAQRISPRQKHLLVELVKIILGGIAGLLLGYAILFWGFRVDPFHFAKILPTGLVPSNLNPPAE